ncbi:hypothetical protein BDN72DRAFT_9377 [Pluteus cervinus]|uniref:Uncharacterized protein n=1 Tax=Pluteus cervinus TaxID=181527 RepID=A0ACD3BFG5_9AGAR|nr:hypothetical protein BDN72DRAFT_9377 [Pluteus cervinus]
MSSQRSSRSSLMLAKVPFIGVVRMTLQSAHIIPWRKIFGGTPDPFVVVSQVNGEELYRTEHIPHTFEPTWLETHYIPTKALKDNRWKIDLYDHHDLRRDALLGSGVIELSSLGVESERNGVRVPVSKDGKERGEVLCDLSFHSADRRPVVSKRWSTTYAGIVSLSIQQAEDLEVDNASPLIVAEIRTQLEGRPLFVTRRETTTNPVWAATYDFFSMRRDIMFVVNVVDVAQGESVQGSLSMNLEDALEASKSGVEWFPLSGCRSGKLRMLISWTPISID